MWVKAGTEAKQCRGGVGGVGGREPPLTAPGAPLLLPVGRPAPRPAP